MSILHGAIMFAFYASMAVLLVLWIKNALREAKTQRIELENAIGHRRVMRIWVKMHEYRERTCRMVDNGVEFCCSICDRRHNYDDEPDFCMGCGAKVVDE